MKRELFMTTDNYGIRDTGMTMDQEFAAIKALGFDGVEHHHPATREVLECLKKYDLKMLHSEIPYLQDGPQDDIDMRFKKVKCHSERSEESNDVLGISNE